MASETVTVTLETDEYSDELQVPADAIDVLNESDGGAPTVVADLAMLGIAQQLHTLINHTQEEIGEDVEQAEEQALELFEERFGRSFAEMTGHDH
jgi:hypothetical protein